MHVRVFVYGSGPRTRRIAATLIADAVPNAPIRSFETEDAAALAASFASSPVLLVDARVAVDPAAFARLARTDANLVARAYRFDGAIDETRAVRRFVDGAALQTNACPLPFSEAVGWWLEEPQPHITPPSRGLGVDFHAYGWGPSGFATASRNLMIGLARAGVEVNWLHWVPETETAEIFPQDRALLERIQSDERKHDRALVFHPPTHTSGQEYLEAYSRAFVGVPYGCVTMFETDSIPVQWNEPIRNASRLWLPSAFNVETFVAGGVSRELIDLVPIGLDIENLPIDGETLDLPERRAVAFVSVFEWTFRKGWDILLGAWAAAFTRDDDVCLIVRTSFRSLDIEKTIRGCLEQWGYDAQKVAPIIVLPKKLTQAQLAALYRSADAYVLPTRGEGFGLPYLEAMALGLPVIGTGWSGMTDFVDAATGYRVDARLAQITSPMISRIVPIYKDQRWAEPSLESTVAQLRRLAVERDEARAIAARGTAVARTQFNRTRIGRIAAAALERIEPHRQVTRAAGSSGRVAIEGDLFSIDGGRADAHGLLIALDAEGFETSIGPDGDRTWLGFVDRPVAAKINAGLRRPPAGDEPTIVSAAPARLAAPRRAGPSIARMVATQASLAPSVVRELQAFDEVWVPSQFSAEIFAQAGIDRGRMAIVPPAIDTERWIPQIGGVEVTRNATTLRFLSVVHWDHRSGWDLAISAFVRAFEPGEDVALTLKIVTEDPAVPIPAFQNDVVDAVRRFAPHRLNVIGSYDLNIATGMSQDVDYIQYVGSFDVLICSSREVGWGRTMLEAMALGVAVVAPRRGNHRAFVSEDNAFLIDVAPTGTPTRFEPSIDALAATMRRLCDRRDEIAGRTHLARHTIVAGHSLAVAGAALRRRVEAHVERCHTIPASQTRVVPEAPPRLGILVDARFEPAGLERTLEWLARMTRSPYDVVVVNDGLSEAFAQLADCPYVAYLRSDVCVSRSWDDFLIDALRVRPHIGFALPRTFGAPGSQGDLDITTDPKVRELEGGFVDFARQISLVHTGRGTTVTSFATCCLMFERHVLTGTLARLGSFDAVEALVRATLADGSFAWCAADSLVHNGGSVARSIVELRPAARA